MKKVMASLTLFSLGLLVAPGSVKAADEPSSGTTQVGITFDAADTNVTPVDPDHPDVSTVNPEPPTANIKPGAQGLSLIYVSPKMNFQDNSQTEKGHAKIDLFQKQSYFAKVKSETPTVNSAMPSFDWNSKFIVEVADGRGADSNWTLKLLGKELSSDTKDTDNKNVIDNAAIDWPKPDVKTSAKTGGIDGDWNVQPRNLPLNSSTSLTILALPKGKGAGITTAQFNPDDIKLTIPVSTAKPGTYSTTLQWTLSNEA